MNPQIYSNHSAKSTSSKINTAAVVLVVAFIVGATVYGLNKRQTDNSTKDENNNGKNAEKLLLQNKHMNETNRKHKQYEQDAIESCKALERIATPQNTQRTNVDCSLEHIRDCGLQDEPIAMIEHKTRKNIVRAVPKVFNVNLNYENLPTDFKVYNCNGVLQDIHEQRNSSSYFGQEIKHLAKYYVDLVKEDSMQDYVDAQQLRDRLWTLATRAFDEFVHNWHIGGGNDKNNITHTRSTIIRYLFGTYRILWAQQLAHPDDQTFSQPIDLECVQQAMERHAECPFVALSVDLMFTNFAYIASIEYKHNYEHTLQATTDYITSALTHLVYHNCLDSVVNFRATNKKATCLNAMATYNAACRLVLQHSLLKGYDNRQITTWLEKLVGHLTFLTHSCRQYYTLAVLCFAANADCNTDEYINKIIQNERDDSMTTFARFGQLQHTLAECDNTDESRKIATAIFNKTMGTALALDTKGAHIQQAKNLLNALKQLQKTETQKLAYNLFFSYINPNITGALGNILKLANKLEYDLQQLYISHYQLNEADLYKKYIALDVDTINLKTLQQYDRDSIAEIQEAFTRLNTTNKRANAFLATLHSLDIEGRTQGLYRPDMQYKHTAATHSAVITLHVITQIVENYKKLSAQQ